MAIKLYKPTTPARRHSSVVGDKLSKTGPKKRLTESFRKTGGRNNQGKITVRHIGGGAKRIYRLVDFKQMMFDIPAVVSRIEYDPFRSAFIALIDFGQGNESYILAPKGTAIGDKVVSSKGALEAKPGNRMPLEFIPAGFSVHNIELESGKGGKLVRSAGLGAVILTTEGNYVHLKMPSGEVRMFPKNARASVGEVSNPDHGLIRKGKAGTVRRLGKRPTVRGKAMNPVDHRHGGGEGAHSIGLPRPVTPWGKPALGVRTRNPNKWTDKLILKRRK